MTAVADTAERAARAREMIGGEPDDLTLARFDRFIAFLRQGASA